MHRNPESPRTSTGDLSPGGHRRLLTEPLRAQDLELPNARFRHVFPPLRDRTGSDSEQLGQRRSAASLLNGESRLHAG